MWKVFSRRRDPLDDTLWSRTLVYCSYAGALAPLERKRLRRQVEQFLKIKSFDGVAGFDVTPAVRAVIALKACVPILNLGIEYYGGWSDIVVYPTDFRVQDEFTDHAGVVHRGTRDLCGQSLSHGPMVLSWEAIADERRAPDRDVVIHECAHKLDVLNGTANGFPPLHAHMSARRWARVFNEAYEYLDAALRAGRDTALDSYAATDPAEFFAVISETFFARPAVVYREFRPAYDELAEFYRQDPYAVIGNDR